MRTFKYAATLIVALSIALSACGGGGSSSASSSAQDVPAQYAGLYDSLSASTDACAATGGGIDSFVVDAHNMAFRGCGNQYWTGAMAGSLHVDPNYPGPVSGTGSASLNTYTKAGAPGATAVLSGAITGATRALTGIPVTSIAFKQSGTNNEQKFQMPDAAAQTITRSYTTFSGSYREQLAGINPAATSTLTVGSDGFFTAATQFGAIAGRITEFSSTSGVHNVQVTLTPTPGAAPVSLIGVLSPAPGLTGSSKDFTSVMLGLSNANLGFAIFFTHN